MHTYNFIYVLQEDS